MFWYAYHVVSPYPSLLNMELDRIFWFETGHHDGCATHFTISRPRSYSQSQDHIKPRSNKTRRTLKNGCKVGIEWTATYRVRAFDDVYFACSFDSNHKHVLISR